MWEKFDAKYLEIFITVITTQTKLFNSDVLWLQNGPIRFYYRIHVPTPLRANLPPLTPSSEPIREPETKKLKSPELLDAVGLRPNPPEARIMPKLDLDSVVKKEVQEDVPVSFIEEKKEEKHRPNTTPSEDTAVSLLLALSNGVGPKQSSEVQPASQTAYKTPDKPAVKTEGPKPATGNGGVFKVPQSLTKRFVFNGGKLVAVKSKSSGGGKSGKLCEKTKLNGKLNGESKFINDRFSNPLGLATNGSLGVQSGRLPPGSPRPPPNSEKLLKTKYMSPSGLALNWPNPEVTVSQNAPIEVEAPSKSPTQPHASSQPKQNSTSQSKVNIISKTPVSIANGQPAQHRKEVNRLEQIVQNCLKKEASLKVTEEVKSRKEVDVKREDKRSGTPTERTGNGEDARAAASICSDHVAPDAGRVDIVTKPTEEGNSSILKRKLNDPPINRRPEVHHNGVAADAKKRRLVTPDVSIELMANPAKEKLQKERKREPSELSTLTKRFLHDIQRMKKIDTELKISKIDQMCASTVKIEKVPAPPSQTVSIPKASPGVDKTKAIDGSDFSSEDDQLFIDIRNKCEALKRKNSEPVSIAIERVTEDQTPKSSQPSPNKSNDSPSVSTKAETPPKSSGTHKKLPRLIEINAPPRPKLPIAVPDPKQKTGLKMTTVRKEVPIGKEGSMVRRDCNGALDLSSGMSPPGAPKNGNKSPFQRPPSVDKSPTPSSLSPLMALASFPSPDGNKASPIRIPTVKPKSSPNPRPSSLSSSSPSPPAEPRSNAEAFPVSAYHQIYRHQIELQSRFLASQVNNNWSRDPLSAKKFEEWMRNVMNLPHHPLMLPSPLSPEATRK